LLLRTPRRFLAAGVVANCMKPDTIMNRIFIVFMILTITSCRSQTNKLFLIEKNTGTENDFSLLVEKKNALMIPADSIQVYLKGDEIFSTKLLESQTYPANVVLEKPVVFRNYGKIYESKKFKAYILLRTWDNIYSKDYKFIIRTYSTDWEIIDSFDLAIWNEKEKNICIGSINRKLIIERKCDNSESSDILQITKDGNIILTSFHKP
jgi:hypothetical protein